MAYVRNAPPRLQAHDVNTLSADRAFSAGSALAAKNVAERRRVPSPSWHAQFQMLRSPPPPPAGWVPLATLSLGLGMSALIVLLAAGHAYEGWPAQYLQDGQPGTWLSAGCIALSAIACLVVAIRSERPGVRVFWGFAALTLAVAAADDLWRFHERADLALHHLLNADPKDPLTDRIDDLIVLLYGVVALCGGVRYRSELLRRPWSVYCFAIAAVFFLVMVIVDVSQWSMTVEETFKILSTLFILIGCLAVSVDPTPAYCRGNASASTSRVSLKRVVQLTGTRRV